ncbi:MAG: pirin family protein [Myxococcota bacterium]
MSDHNTASTDPVAAVKPLGFPWETRDPFIFCVYHKDDYPTGNPRMGPTGSLAGRQLGQDFTLRDGWRMYHGQVVPGFPQHPHRGFETVTVVRRGLVDHSDSLGATARYGRGDVQWLTAGSGILHAEMFPLVDPERPNPLELFQIWLNLPSASKMVDPHFTMLWSDKIPQRTFHDSNGKATQVTLVAGRHGDHDGLVAPSPPPDSWASQADSDVAIWTIEMAAGATWTLPAVNLDTNRTLYLFSGAGLQVGARSIATDHRIDLRGHAEVRLTSGPEPVDLLLLQGRPIAEPVVQHGPFVMNTPAEIEQAFRDYQRTQFGGWPWDRNDPVHPRDKGRFARHADGRIERPT